MSITQMLILSASIQYQQIIPKILLFLYLLLKYQLCQNQTVSCIILMSYNFCLIFSFIKQRHNIDFNSFHSAIDSRKRLLIFQKTPLRLSCPRQFISDLMKSNLVKLFIILILSILSVLISVMTPFFNNFILDNFVYNSSVLYGWGLLLAIIFFFKIIKNGITILLDLNAITLGYQYFAITYFNLLKKKKKLNGIFLNLIETDCQKLTNFCYCLITILINPIEIIILMCFIIKFLMNSKHILIFSLILIGYCLLYIIVSYFTYQINQQYLKQKDKRLSLNIHHSSNKCILYQRQVELNLNNKFLYLQILVKFISYSFYIILIMYSFVITERIQVASNQFILLILIGLVRTPIDRLIFASNLFIEIIFSIKRIITFVKLLQNQNEYLLASQFILSPSDFRLKSKKLKRRQIYYNLQKGDIKLILIGRYLIQEVPKVMIASLIALIMMTFIGKYFNLQISNSIISNNYNVWDIVGLIYQIIIPLMTLFMIIRTIFKLSFGVFKKIKFQQTFTSQFLNRITGDITAIDKSLCLNGYQLISIVFSIVASLIYSLVSLQSLIIQIVFFIFMLICIYFAFRFYRQIMKSRRQVARKQYFLKSKIIFKLMQNKNIDESKSLLKFWKQIFQSKEVGFLIQISYNLILFVILLIFSTCLIILSVQLNLQKSNRSIIILACMQIDNDILTMFISAIRFEKALISFERVLNAIKYK